jgi:3-hydroxyisobutyrate dehydrogenase-like beta-hydroxyacid dehydrogenase
MKVSFIGLGNMGAAMAGNLLKAGYQVTVYNRTPPKAHTLVAQGARLANSLPEACRGDAVMTMLANDAAVESPVFGSEGLQSGAIRRAADLG